MDSYEIVVTTWASFKIKLIEGESILWKKEKVNLP